MAVYRCGKCGFVGELTTQAAGSKVPCGQCATASVLFDTPFYVSRLVERYLASRRELESLKQLDENPEQEVPAESAAPPPELERLKDDLQDTNVLATAAQHKPLLDWFAAKQIKAAFDFGLVDTTGFFDEAAKGIGDRYDLFSGVLDQVRYAYRKDFSWINIDLSKKEPGDAQAINSFLRELYSHTFFARHVYTKKTKMLGLAKQPAAPVRKFFEGEWLEWYAFMHLLELCVARGRTFSCARGVKVEFKNEELRELDVVFLVDGRSPIFIECKSGEFRGEIDKYVNLRRRLNIKKTELILCSAELTNDQAKGLNAMYELTFVNVESLKGHLAELVTPSASVSRE